ncbi:hypothetical protein N0V88_006893 [Collariella sp. IMI 366227]|nr:hypothetical protein N0V88_006893 [Collariella sp. IMI 366227]
MHDGDQPHLSPAAALTADANPKNPANGGGRSPTSTSHTAPNKSPNSKSATGSPHAVLRDLPQQDHPGILAAGPDDELDDDEFSLTDGFETASGHSTSVTPSVYAHTIENGRRYQYFKNGRYPFPNDDRELNREDMKHAMLLELCDGELFYAPIAKDPQMILDVGTGTGAWAIDVGDKYPTARVRGIDLSPTQAVWVPPNVEFLIDDCEKENWLDHDVDLVHLRFMTTILKDVPAVLKNAYESLKPGGWIELQDLSAEILCSDSTLPPSDPVHYLYTLCGRAFSQFGMDVTLPKRLRPLLEGAGFENIQCVVKKVPIGPWARDKTMRVIGKPQHPYVDILASLCPNLKTLYAITGYFDVFRFYRPDSMPSLHSVVLSYVDTELGINMKNAAPLFRAAPSITKMIFYMLSSSDNLGFTLDKLTSLELQRSTLDGESLVNILVVYYGMGDALVSYELFTTDEARAAFFEHGPKLNTLRLDAKDNDHCGKGGPL